jgi:hypothetical protein
VLVQGENSTLLLFSVPVFSELVVDRILSSLFCLLSAELALFSKKEA